MSDPLPAALSRALDARPATDDGELRAVDGELLVAWTPGSVRGRPLDAGKNAELVTIDAEGVLPVQLSHGRGAHDAGGGLAGRLATFWKGAMREAIFVELRGRRRVRLHAIVDDHPALAALAADLPQLALDGSVEVAPDGLLDLLAALRAREARFLLGAPEPDAGPRRPIVTDDDPGVAALPAVVWLALPASSPWQGRRVDELDTSVYALGRAGGAFIPASSDRLDEGDVVLVAARCGELASLRRAAGVAAPLQLERAMVAGTEGGELLLSAGDFGATEHDPGRRPLAWRYPGIGERAGTMVSLVDVTDFDADQELTQVDWPDGAQPVAVRDGGQWRVGSPGGARGEGWVILAGDRLAVAEAETRL